MKTLKNENKENKSNRIYSESETNTNFRYNFYPEGWLIDKKENLDKLACIAVEQIYEKHYDAEMEGTVYYVGLAHCGKHVCVRWEEATAVRKKN